MMLLGSIPLSKLCKSFFISIFLTMFFQDLIYFAILSYTLILPISQLQTQ